MTAARAGYLGVVLIGAAPVAEWTRASIKAGKDKIEVTSIDSAMWKEFLQGHKEWSFTLEMMLYMGDTTGQKVLVDSYINDALLTGATALTIADYSGGNVFGGDVFVTDLGADLPFKDGQKLTMTFQGTAALAYT